MNSTSYRNRNESFNENQNSEEEVEVSKEEYKCAKCEISCDSIPAMMSHISSVHFVCGICKIEFSSEMGRHSIIYFSLNFT